MSKIGRCGLGVGIAVTTSTISVRADGIDIAAWLTRFDPDLPVVTLLGLVALFAVVNYLVNLLVIGLPALKWGVTSFGSVAFGLVLLTVLGQVADRFGAYASLFLEGPITSALHLRGGDGWVLVLFLTNFVISGITVGVVALYFLHRWWRVPGRQAIIVAVVAAVITNPTWVLATWLSWK